MAKQDPFPSCPRMNPSLKMALEGFYFWVSNLPNPSNPPMKTFSIWDWMETEDPNVRDALIDPTLESEAFAGEWEHVWDRAREARILMEQSKPGERDWVDTLRLDFHQLERIRTEEWESMSDGRRRFILEISE